MSRLRLVSSLILFLIVPQTVQAAEPQVVAQQKIWDDGKLLPFHRYLRQFNMELAPALEGKYLRFGKTPRFGTDLELILQIDLSRISPNWDGVKCVYRRVPAGIDDAARANSR